jgi:tetratricopeptide (TPR) repeat protein
VFLLALLSLALSIACTRLPLLNYLGYEFSLCFAVLGSLVAGFGTVGVVKSALAQADGGIYGISQRATSAFTRSLTVQMTLLLIPLLVMATNALFVKNCSLTEGFVFFVLLPVVSVLCAASLGFVCAVLFHHARTVFVLVFLATLGYSAALGYFTPGIFSYNFFYGYFPGLTYDEALDVSWTLVLFRVFTLVIAASLVWVAVLILKRTTPTDTLRVKGTRLLKAVTEPSQRMVALVLLLLIGLGVVYRHDLGFESSASFIRRCLGSTLVTEHFRIYYANESYSPEEIKWIGAEHEFFLHEIVDVLHVRFHGSIESYIYPSNAAKQRLIGTGSTNIAKPWSGQIHTSKQSLEGTLKHELVHVLAAPFGVPVLRASLSTGLVEGLAVAIDGEWGSRTLHEYAAGLRKFGVASDISGFMTLTGFASRSSSISYVLAGSFCRFLLDRYGVRRMMQLYRTGDYQAVYGRALPELMVEWQNLCDRIPVPENGRGAIDVLFRRPPIFQKVCARVVAARNLEAGADIAKGRYAAAANLYARSFDDGKGYDALSGYLASSLYAGNYHVLTAAFDTIIARDSRPSQFLPLFVNIGIAYWAEGELHKAKDLFGKVAAADVQEGLTEAALVCSAALDDSANRGHLLRYFLSAAHDTLRIPILDSMVHDSRAHWLPVFLKGRALSRLHRWDETVRVLRSLDPLASEPQLEAVRLKTLGYALLRSNRFQEARVSYWTSLNFVSTGFAKNDIDGWLERCEWLEQRSFVDESPRTEPR